jgi:ribonuclease VapC
MNSSLNAGEKLKVSSSVLDASAILAFDGRESGMEAVRQALAEGAILSAVNLSEVVAKFISRGVSETDIRGRIAALDLEIADFDAESAYKAGLLQSSTARAGLSLGDRACLALAHELDLPVLTADRAWKSLDLGIDIRMIR